MTIKFVVSKLSAASCARMHSLPWHRQAGTSPCGPSNPVAGLMLKILPSRLQKYQQHASAQASSQCWCCTGQRQPGLAQDAVRILCDEKSPHHQITLSTAHPDGTTRHTLYEMWPAQVLPCPQADICQQFLVAQATVHQQKYGVWPAGTALLALWYELKSCVPLADLKQPFVSLLRL